MLQRQKWHKVAGESDQTQTALCPLEQVVSHESWLALDLKPEFLNGCVSAILGIGDVFKPTVERIVGEYLGVINAQG